MNNDIFTKWYRETAIERSYIEGESVKLCRENYAVHDPYIKPLLDTYFSSGSGLFDSILCLLSSMKLLVNVFTDLAININTTYTTNPNTNNTYNPYISQNTPHKEYISQFLISMVTQRYTGYTYNKTLRKLCKDYIYEKIQDKDGVSLFIEYTKIMIDLTFRPINENIFNDYFGDNKQYNISYNNKLDVDWKGINDGTYIGAMIYLIVDVTETNEYDVVDGHIVIMNGRTYICNLSYGRYVCYFPRHRLLMCKDGVIPEAKGYDEFLFHNYAVGELSGTNPVYIPVISLIIRKNDGIS